MKHTKTMALIHRNMRFMNGFIKIGYRHFKKLRVTIQIQPWIRHQKLELGNKYSTENWNWPYQTFDEFVPTFTYLQEEFQKIFHEILLEKPLKICVKHFVVMFRKGFWKIISTYFKEFLQRNISAEII